MFPEVFREQNQQASGERKETICSDSDEQKCWGAYNCLAGAQPEARLKFPLREGNHVSCRDEQDFKDRHSGSCL